MHREASLGNIFAALFLLKIENFHTPLRKSKYYSGQERRPGPTKSWDVREQKFPSLQRSSTELILAMPGESKLSAAEHLQAPSEERRDKKNLG